PLAMAMLAAPAKPPRAPPDLENPPPPSPPAKPPPPVGGVPPPVLVKPPPPAVAHFPLDAGWLMVTVRAAMVVLDFFDGVPVMVRQSPAARSLTALTAVSVQVVVGVQLTVV